MSTCYDRLIEGYLNIKKFYKIIIRGIIII